MIKKIIEFLVFSICYPLSFAYAENADIEVIEPFSMGQFVRTLLSLLVVCSAAIIIIKYLAGKNRLTRILDKSPKNGRLQNIKLKVVDRLIIDRHNQLLVIEVGSDQSLLISSGANGVLVHGSISSAGIVTALNQEFPLQKLVKEN